MDTLNPSCPARASLDQDQLAAVTTDSRRALVLAGAGSGKTRVLTERIAYLIEKCHASPSEIVALAFTRKAAGEMRERLVARIGRAAYGVTLGTMHALALRQLQRFGEVIGLRPEKITVYSEWEEDFLLRTVATEIGALKGKSWKIPKKAVDLAFSTFYATGIEPAKFDPAYNLFNAFMGRCRENNALTYGGILNGFMLLLPLVKQYMGWRHILVDEVQDLDRLQWGLIEAMARDLPATLFAVGDVDQSIYEWRGAAPEYLVENADSFEVLRLARNYRSDAKIVMAANRLIENNVARLPKAMIPMRMGEPERHFVSVVRDMDSHRVAELVPGAFPPGDIAVLSRKHVLLQRMAEELDARGVPYNYVGRKAALTNPEEFRRFHAFLKLIVNPYDNFAFLLIKDILGLTPEEYSAVRALAVQLDIGHLGAWLANCDANHRASGFFSAEGGPDRDAADAAAMVGGIIGGSQDDPPHPALAFVMEWHQRAPFGRKSVAEYLEWLATYDVQDEITTTDPDGAGVVTLATIHGAKGLEWPCVILAGCNEGILPSERAVRSGDIEEERRLAYVAITRARDVLIMAVRPERTEKPGRDGQMRLFESPVSRFVAESMGDSHA